MSDEKLSHEHILFPDLDPLRIYMRDKLREINHYFIMLTTTDNFWLGIDTFIYILNSEISLWNQQKKNLENLIQFYIAEVDLIRVEFEDFIRNKGVTNGR